MFGNTGRKNVRRSHFSAQVDHHSTIKYFAHDPIDDNKIYIYYGGFEDDPMTVTAPAAGQRLKT